MSSTVRDAQAAKDKAATRITRAHLIAAAVEAFHAAADEIDQSRATLAGAGQKRSAAIRSLRDAGLSIADIAELTGLSASRIQALVKE